MTVREYDDSDYFLGRFEEIEDDDNVCWDCGRSTPPSGYCEPCDDKLDIDGFEEAKRKRLFEEQEY